jgi:hypothetical protein
MAVPQFVEGHSAEWVHANGTASRPDACSAGTSNPSDRKNRDRGPSEANVPNVPLSTPGVATATARPSHSGCASRTAANRASTSATSSSARCSRPRARPTVRVCTCHGTPKSTYSSVWATVGAICEDLGIGARVLDGDGEGAGATGSIRRGGRGLPGGAGGGPGDGDRGQRRQERAAGGKGAGRGGSTRISCGEEPRGPITRCAASASPPSRSAGEVKQGSVRSVGGDGRWGRRVGCRPPGRASPARRGRRRRPAAAR